ncbi:MAG TPA: carboxylesterase family protein, partial [Vicinamibacterales bacterium]|nr:carboxylesterase family protein [Vicinamibacterales bacterium]
QLRGALINKDGAASIAVFKGIPYARPPIGDLRWREPLPAVPWTAVREATTFGAPCAQNATGRVLESSSEDCLYLNVWTAEWPLRFPKPVLVWLHGGGNFAGTASDVNSSGEHLARRGLVVVTLTYRLGPFGFFAHPALTRESAHHASGNYGLMDQIAALRWVHDNIGSFGGDPSRVTLGGQSAGAVDVNVIMTSPLAKGLFHRAIAQSGTVSRVADDATIRMTGLATTMAARSRDTYSDALTLVEAERAGAEVGDNPRALSTAALLQAASGARKSIGPANGIIVDGWVLPESPAETFIHGREHRVPLLVGSNARERTPDVTGDALVAAAQSMYGPLADRALALYGFSNATTDALYGTVGAQWVVDTMYRCPVVMQQAWHAAAANRAYQYQFDRAPPGREAVGATHGVELPYVFGVTGARWVDADRAISEAIQTYWANFATSGNPNLPTRSSSLPEWPTFTASTLRYMEFTDSGPIARAGLRRPYCDLYLDNITRLRRLR